MDVNWNSDFVKNRVPHGHYDFRGKEEMDLQPIYIGQLSGVPEPGSDTDRKMSDDAASVELSQIGRILAAGRDVGTNQEQFTQAMNEAAEGFGDFLSKIESVGYSSDITIDDIDFSHLEKLQDVYQSWKDNITRNYTEEFRDQYLKDLDEAYDSIFREKILDPLKRAYGDKMSFFKPDDAESMSNIKTYSSSREVMEATVANYMSIQASKRVQYEDLQGGWEKLNSLFEDKAKWHDTEAVKATVTDAMETYSAHKSWLVDTTLQDLMKAYANARAKEISDKYAEEHPLDRLEGKEEGMYMGDKKLDLGSYLKDFIANNSFTTVNGMYMMDFSKIENLKEIIDGVTDRFRAESGQKAAQEE